MLLKVFLICKNIFNEANCFLWSYPKVISFLKYVTTPAKPDRVKHFTGDWLAHRSGIVAVIWRFLYSPMPLGMVQYCSI
jgi:hypothetical protein